MADELELSEHIRRLQDYHRRSMQTALKVQYDIFQERLAKLATACALLNSMVLSGESHSDESRAIVRAAFEAAAESGR